MNKQIKLAGDNYILLSPAYSLEKIEFAEQIKTNVLQKKLLEMNRKKIKDAILKIGTMIAYNNKANKQQLRKMHLA